MRRVVILVVGLCLGGFLNGQIADRYTSPIFSNVTETNNILFSTGVPQPRPGGGFYETLTGYPINVEEYNTDPVDLYMDIFEPTGDVQEKRPLIIICFGGGFVAGERTYWSIRLLAQELAKRGFVTASIDYRLGMNMFDEGLAMRAVYRGLQDGRSAVRFFKADADGPNNYRIDPDNIYIGGHSAGAFIATHNAYMETESERPISTITYTQSEGTFFPTIHDLPDQGCLDCVGDNQGYSGHAKAIFSLAGALGFLDYMDTANDPQLVMFHSTDDGTVPYDSGEPFGNISFLVIGSDLPEVHGSNPMSARANALGIPYEFNSYTNRGHGVHEDGTSALYNDIVPGISNWFYNQLLKPPAHQISGAISICDQELTQEYTTVAGQAEYYDWEIEGGIFDVMDNASNSVTVTWDASAATHKISLTPYSCNGAPGDKEEISVSIGSEFTNTWIPSSSGSWLSPSNWSLGRIPNICDHVIIPDKGSAISVDFSSATTSSIRTLTVENNSSLMLSASGTIEVKGD